MYPSEKSPTQGTFVKSQIESLKKYIEIDLLLLPGFGGVLPYIKFIPQIRKALKKRSYDIVHVHYGNAASLVKLLNYTRVPVITSYCGDDLLGTITSKGTYSFKSVIFKHINKFFARFDKHSIVKSENLAAQINRCFPSIIPNGVDTSKFTPLDQNKCKSQLGIPTNQKLILFPAEKNNAVKNFPLLENALKEIPSNQYNLLYFKERVMPDMMPIYLNAADLVVCTSINEGSPNVIKEAMSCNKMIFSTPCGDVPSLLDGATGSKILNYESQSWTSALKQFLNENQNNIQINSRTKLIEKKLDNDSVAKNIVSIYYDVIGKPIADLGFI